MKKIILAFYLVISVFSYSLTVYDPANYAVNLDTKLNTLQQIDNQIRSLENEARSLVNQARQLQKFDMSLSIGSIQQLRNNLQKIISLQNDTKSTINDYVNLQNKFQDLYPNWEDRDGYTSTDYSLHAKKLSDEMNNVTYDTMKSLELLSPDKYNSDTERIDAIIDSAKDAEGQLQAIQATGQLSALTAQQIMELKYLTGQSLKLQSTYIAEQNQQKIANQSYEEWHKSQTIDTSGKSSGIIDKEGNLLLKFKE